MSKRCAIIIPCYNEGNRILADEFLSFLDKNQHFYFVFVDDGSTDNTFSILEKLSQHNNISCLKIKKNKGKGEAVRFGSNYILKNNKYDYLGFLDADLAIPLEELEDLYKGLREKENIDFVYYSKNTKLNNELETKFKRVFVGRILSALVQWSLKVNVYDTQCGCKLMTQELAKIVFHDQFISPWLFDVEMFWRLINRKGRDYIQRHTEEVPLKKLLNRGDSKVTITDLIKLPLEFLKIHQFYKKGVDGK